MEVDKGPSITIKGHTYYVSDMTDYERKRFNRLNQISEDIKKYTIRLEWLKELEERYFNEAYNSLRQRRR